MKVDINELYKVKGIGKKTLDRIREEFKEKDDTEKIIKNFEPTIINRHELYKGDCLEVMDYLISKGVKVDAIITDPPYGTTACKWDSIIPFDEMWGRLKQLRRDNTPIVLFGIEPFSSTVRLSNMIEYKHDWVWNKEIAGNFIQAKNHPLKSTENIMTFCGNKVNYYPIMEKAKEKNKRPKSIKKQKTSFLTGIPGGEFKNSKDYNSNLRYPKHIININAREKECNNINRLHPTQKPVKLLEYLIKTYTKENDVVLDFTMGSGSTGVACDNLDRKFIGIELDEDYFEIAVDRIRDN